MKNPINVVMSSAKTEWNILIWFICGALLLCASQLIAIVVTETLRTFYSTTPPMFPVPIKFMLVIFSIAMTFVCANMGTQIIIWAARMKVKKVI